MAHISPEINDIPLVGDMCPCGHVGKDHITVAPYWCKFNKNCECMGFTFVESSNPPSYVIPSIDIYPVWLREEEINIIIAIWESQGILESVVRKIHNTQATKKIRGW